MCRRQRRFNFSRLPISESTRITRPGPTETIKQATPICDQSVSFDASLPTRQDPTTRGSSDLAVCSATTNPRGVSKVDLQSNIRAKGRKPEELENQMTTAT
jgi:hypothetical protein